MKKTKKTRRPSGRTTTPAPPAADREPARQTTEAAAGTTAPEASEPQFKAGKDL